MLVELPDEKVLGQCAGLRESSLPSHHAGQLQDLQLAERQNWLQPLEREARLLRDDLAIVVSGNIGTQVVVVLVSLDRPEKVKSEGVGVGVEVLPEVGAEVLDRHVSADLGTVASQHES